MNRTTHIMAIALAGLLAGSALAQSRSGGVGDVSTKGSLLVFPTVEVKWDIRGQVVQDTLLSITNDASEEIYVQFYLVNGDEPIPDSPLKQGHPGWNWADCQILLTPDQPTYWSAATGLPAGCQPFSVLDDGTPPGRPDSEGPIGTRTLRGMVVGWAVNLAGQEVSWNHLSGAATQINYTDSWSWEYGAYVFRANAPMGSLTDSLPGVLRLDGLEYDSAPDRLVFNFFGVGARLRNGLNVATVVDTDLTLMPVQNDLRQDTNGPVTTKAKFDIWNMNETRLSGTEICVTCWNQTLLSDYEVPNNFKVENLQTDIGKARIDGMQSQVCDVNCSDGEGGEDSVCSQENPLLGVAQKLIRVGSIQTGVLSSAGSTLIGMGEQPATIWYDIIRPTDGGNDPTPQDEGDTSLDGGVSSDERGQGGSSNGASSGVIRSRR